MQLSIMVIEDEFIISEDIKAALLANGYKLFGTALSYDQAMDMLKKDRPDFALVDITLGSAQDGLKLGRMFSEDMRIPFIYVTSHADAGTLEKVKLTGPSGYLLKPFRRDAIHAAIEVAMMNFKQHGEGTGNEKALTLRKGEDRVRVKYNEILYLESDGNYTNIQTVTNRFTERKTLKEMLEDMCDHPLIRIHKSYAINKNKIHHFTREKVFIASYNVPIGRRYADEIRKFIAS